MNGLWLIGPAALLLAVLLYLEKTGSRRAMVPAKGALSSLFVVAAVIQPWPLPAYADWILAGLFLSLAGDILLALLGDRPFLPAFSTAMPSGCRVRILVDNTGITLSFRHKTDADGGHWWRRREHGRHAWFKVCEKAKETGYV